MASEALVISVKDRATLESWTRSRSIRASHVERARIVLAVADGGGTSAAARQVGVSRPTVIKWRDRFVAHGVAGLDDEARSGRPKQVDDSAIIAATLEPPPASLAVTHWSSRCWASTSASGTRRWPGRDASTGSSRGGVRRSSSPPTPELEAKVRDVVGLYLNPPTNAVVLCVDEKSQIQALNRTAPILPLREGLPERATHDYRRNGTTTLFAALEVATGKVTDKCYDRHGKAEFGDFLRKVAKAYPRRQLHVVLDNYHTHKHPEITTWLEKNPRVHLHFTPTSGSWLNLVEVFFGIITRQAIRRGSSTTSRNSSPRSALSSTAGTTDAAPSPGPRPPTRSCRTPPVNEIQMRDTRSDRGGNPTTPTRRCRRPTPAR
jgi:transposase